MMKDWEGPRLYTARMLAKRQRGGERSGQTSALSHGERCGQTSAP